MARAWWGVLGVLLFFAGCRERNPEFVPEAEGTTDASVGESGSASSGVTSNTSASTSASATTGETSSVSNSAGESSSTSDPGESSTSDPGSESGDPLVPYPACDPEGAPCPRGYDDCVVASDPPISWCSHWCVHTSDCEPPLTGDAPAICWGHDCMLDCSDGQICPDGMVCGAVSDNARCGWPS
ncbi:MAG TPA: hypothetical protein VG755_35490 [Nannocystaceae bacterium]|nr:hypothetical protein [Nannocystaceae bacterium]